MACAAIFSGDRFLWNMIGHIDCQARAIGSYGYGALADPTSSISIVTSGALTLFVALFGLRLILGRAPSSGDVVQQLMKIGIVLLLATSWPAWRILAYDTVLDAPVELAHMISVPSGLPDDSDNLRARLQSVDDGLVALTRWGTGRLPEPDTTTRLFDSFRGIALGDETGLAWGRVLFLMGAIGPYAIVSLTAGLLLALAPLMAGLLLFDGTSGIFTGWIKGLISCALGSLALYLVQRVEVAIMQPWLIDLIVQRSSGSVTPSAPTELMALALSFAATMFGSLLLLAWVAFHSPSWAGQWLPSSQTRGVISNEGIAQTKRDVVLTPQDRRAYHVSEAVAATVRREERDGMAEPMAASAYDARQPGGISRPADGVSRVEPLGSSFRRSQRRISAAGRLRDGKP